jgi:hypothetical protein
MLERNIVNGIELYTIGNQALKDYRDGAKKDKNISRDILERKLTGLILNCFEKKRIVENKYMCRFGTFVMVVNEFTRMIETILWDTDNHTSRPVPKYKWQNLINTYKQLGLNKSGNRLLELEKVEC